MGKNILIIFICLLGFFTRAWAQDGEIKTALKEQQSRWGAFAKTWKKLSPAPSHGIAYFSPRTTRQIFGKFFRRNFLAQNKFTGGKLNSLSVRALKFKGQNGIVFQIFFRGLANKKPFRGVIDLRGTMGRSKNSNCLNLFLKVQKTKLLSNKPSSLAKNLSLKLAQEFQQKQFVVGPFLKSIPLRIGLRQRLEIPIRIAYLKVHRGYSAFEVYVNKRLVAPLSPLFPLLLRPESGEDPMETLSDNEDILSRIESMVEETKKIEEKAFSQRANLIIEIRPSVAVALARLILPHSQFVGRREIKGKVSLDFIGKVTLSPTGLGVNAGGSLQFSHLSPRRYPLFAPIFPSVKNKKIHLTLGGKAHIKITPKGRLDIQIKGTIQNLKFTKKDSLSSSILAKTLTKTLNLFLERRLSSFHIRRVRFYVPLFGKRPELKLVPKGIFFSYSRVYVLLDTQALRPVR